MVVNNHFRIKAENNLISRVMAETAKCSLQAKPVPCLALYIKFYWNTAVSTCLYIVCSSFCANG